MIFYLISTVLGQILSVDFQPSNNTVWCVTSINQVVNQVVAGFADGSIKSYHGNTHFVGHTDQVYNLLASDTLFSGSKDTLIKQWDTNGVLIRNYTGHTDAVIYLALSGTTLYSASADTSIRAWRTDGTYLSNFTGHSGEVWGLAIDGDNLFSASIDKTAKQWSISTGMVLKTYIGHTDFVTAVIVYGTSLFTASDDATIRQWDIVSGKLIAILYGHSAGIRSLAIASTSLLSGSKDSTVIEWDLNNNMALVRQYQVHTADVNAISVTKDPKIVLSASSDGSVKQWALTPVTPTIVNGNATGSFIPVDSSSTSLSIGVIIGIVIGTVAFLFIVSFVAVCVWRQRFKAPSHITNKPLTSSPISIVSSDVIPSQVGYETPLVPVISPRISQPYPNQPCPTQVYPQNYAPHQQYLNDHPRMDHQAYEQEYSSARNNPQLHPNVRMDHQPYGQVRPTSMQHVEHSQREPYPVQEVEFSQLRPTSMQHVDYSQREPYPVQEVEFSQGIPTSMRHVEFSQGRHHSIPMQSRDVQGQVPQGSFPRRDPPSYDHALLASLAPEKV